MSDDDLDLPLSARKSREALDSPGSRTVQSLERLNTLLDSEVETGNITRESLEGGVRGVFTALEAQLEEDTEEPNADKLTTAVGRALTMMAKRADDDAARLAGMMIEYQAKTDDQRQIIDELTALVTVQHTISTKRISVFEAEADQKSVVIKRLEKARADLAAEVTTLKARADATGRLSSGLAAKVESIVPGSTQDILTSAVRDGMSSFNNASKSSKHDPKCVYISSDFASTPG